MEGLLSTGPTSSSLSNHDIFIQKSEQLLWEQDVGVEPINCISVSGNMLAVGGTQSIRLLVEEEGGWRAGLRIQGIYCTDVLITKKVSICNVLS